MGCTIFSSDSKPWIGSQDLRKEIRSEPLLIFKLGLSLLVLIQVACWLFDFGAVFTEGGLFPRELVNLYNPSRLLGWDENFFLILLLLQAVLAICVWFSRWQNGALLLLFVIEVILRKRNFFFTNLGDHFLGVLCLYSALTPAVSLRKREAIYLYDILPLSLLTSIVYAQNFYFKVTGRWGEGLAVEDILQHLELIRSVDVAHLLAPFSGLLTYLGLLIVFLSIFTPFVNPQKTRWRWGLVTANIGYHVFANVIMSLSWLSLPFMISQIPLLVFYRSQMQADLRPAALGAKFYIGLFLCLSGFYGIKQSEKLWVFSTTNNIFYTHNWNMFAPPPPSTGFWVARSYGPAGVHEISQEDLVKLAGLKDSQHSYKFFYNLRRAESEPLRQHWLTQLCQKIQPNPSQVEMEYQVYFFQNKKTEKIFFGKKECVN